MEVLESPDQFFLSLLVSSAGVSCTLRRDTAAVSQERQRLEGCIGACVCLQEGLSTAQRHITIASLYIGTEGGREEQFVRALAAAVHDASRPQLEVDILVDALRSTRPTKSASGALPS